MKIAAGVGKNRRIIDASNKVDFEVVLRESGEELLELLIKGEVDAAVRGSLSASEIMGELRKKYDHKIFRASFLEVNSHRFLLAPVGIDEGDNVVDKVQIVELGAEFLLKLGLKPKIAVISGGRAQDVGRSDKIDESIAQAEQVTEITKNKYSVKHYFILIENTIADGCNFILAPEGISGNLIFRTLVFLGSGRSYGAVTLGIEEIFIDTSRSQGIEGYIRALKFANHLANKLK